MNGKKLYRSESNRRLCGVCAGIEEYFDLDPTLIRLTKRPSFYLEDSRKPKQRVRKKERSNDNFKWGDEK